MAKAPATPRRPSRSKRSAQPERKRSHGGRIIAAVTGLAGSATVLSGLAIPFPEPAVVCGGTERWPVKVTADKDAVTGKIDLMPGAPVPVSQVNTSDQFKPGPYPVGGRMDVEKKVYTVRGFLSFFKHEGTKKGDKDYHVVITDQPGQFEEDERKPPNGHSMVVEFPDPKCFAGKPGGAGTSALGQAIVDARTTFEQHVDWPDEKRLTQSIPVTVTGVGFFDFDHGQTGRATPRIGVDGKRKVFELHPVTEIVFETDPDPD